MSNVKKLIWEEKYSVGVEIIDNQHKKMFMIMNEIFDILHTTPDKDTMYKIVNELVEYKRHHFATEENYFKEFNFEDAEKHIAQHRWFDKKINEIEKEYADNLSVMAFQLIDFLEDWFIKHIMTADHEFTQCFREHGLK